MNLARKLAVVVVALGSVSVAQADLILGHASGVFYGNLNQYNSETGFSGRDISTDDAHFYFAYDTDLAPDPYCYNDNICESSSGSDDGDWLWAAFDFGEFVGHTIPGTATLQRVVLREQFGSDLDRIDVALDVDWNTSFGEMSANDLFYTHWSESLDMFDLPSSLIPESGSYTGEGGIYQNRVGGINGDIAWEVEYAFRSSWLEIYRVPEPGALALFGIGLAAMGLARRRKV